MGTKKVKRVVIDTNVVISGLLFGGTPGQIVSLWKSGFIHPLVTAEILEEYLKVLAYPKFNLSEQEIIYLIYHEIMPYFEIVEVCGQLSASKAVTKDLADDKFIYCALAGNAEVIISGDRHLLEIGSFKEINIQNPTQFLNNFYKL